MIQRLCSWCLHNGAGNLCRHKTCAWVFIVTTFTMKQPRCPEVHKCLNKLWYIQTTEYSPALKRNVLSSHEKTCRNHKYTFSNERSQSEKVTFCMIPTIWHPGKGKIIKTMKSLMVAGGRVINRWSIKYF